MSKIVSKFSKNWFKFLKIWMKSVYHIVFKKFIDFYWFLFQVLLTFIWQPWQNCSLISIKIIYTNFLYINKKIQNLKIETNIAQKIKLYITNKFTTLSNKKILNFHLQTHALAFSLKNTTAFTGYWFKSGSFFADRSSDVCSFHFGFVVDDNASIVFKANSLASLASDATALANHIHVLNATFVLGLPKFHRSHGVVTHTGRSESVHASIGAQNCKNAKRSHS